MPLRLTAAMMTAGLVLCATARGQAEPQLIEETPVAEVEGNPYFAEIRAAIAAFDAGDWTAALAGFERAHALQPSARTWRGIALAAFYGGDCVRARYAMEAAVHEANKLLTDLQRTELGVLLSPCSLTTGRLELRLTPADAIVTVDGEQLASAVLIATPGVYRLEAHAEGREPVQRELAIAAGQSDALELALPHAIAPPAAKAPAQRATSHGTDAQRSAHSEREPAARPLRTAAWISTVAVPVLLGTAAAIWLVGLSEHEALDRECRLACDTAEIERRADASDIAEYERWTNVALVAAGAAAATASVLWLVDAGRDDESSAVAIEASPFGGRIHGRF